MASRKHDRVLEIERAVGRVEGSLEALQKRAEEWGQQSEATRDELGKMNTLLALIAEDLREHKRRCNELEQQNQLIRIDLMNRLHPLEARLLPLEERHKKTNWLSRGAIWVFGILVGVPGVVLSTLQVIEFLKGKQ